MFNCFLNKNFTLKFFNHIKKLTSHLDLKMKLFFLKFYYNILVAQLSNKTRKCSEFTYTYKENETSAVQAVSLSFIFYKITKKSKLVLLFNTN